MIISEQFIKDWEDLKKIGRDVDNYIWDMSKAEKPIRCAWDLLPKEEKLKPMLMVCICPKCSVTC